MGTGAHLLASALARAGVRTLFTLSGNQIMPLYDPLIAAGVEPLHTRHEAAAVHMADAHARLTESPCPVLLTAGPGHANALTALYVAQMAESAVVLLSGASEASHAGLGAFQEMDQAGLARRVAKAAWVVRDPSHLGRDLARAYRLAGAGRPGPVSLSLPADVLRAACQTEPPSVDAFVARRPRASTSEVARVLGLIGEARRPLLLAGPAMARGERWRTVAALAERLGVPALPMESPRGANDPTLGGVRRLFPEADLVVLVGRRPDFSLGFGRPSLFGKAARFLQIETEAASRRDDLPMAMASGSDPLVLVTAALEAAPAGSRGDRAWLEQVDAASRLGRDDWAARARSSARPIHPLRLMAAARPLLRSGDVFVGDGGEFGQWAQAGGPHRGSGIDRVINGPSGAIGGSIPFAIGAKVARPDARVLAFLGDGTCGYHIAEFETAARAGIPFVAVVGNDGVWNAEVQIQRQLGGSDLAFLHLGATRYDRVVEALGGHGVRVDEPDDLEPSLRRALEAARPALVDVAVAPVPAPTYRDGH